MLNSRNNESSSRCNISGAILFGQQLRVCQLLQEEAKGTLLQVKTILLQSTAAIERKEMFL